MGDEPLRVAERLVKEIRPLTDGLLGVATQSPASGAADGCSDRDIGVGIRGAIAVLV